MMKKIVTLLVAALVCIGSLSAQSRTSYFMEGSYFRNDLNPALAPTRGYLVLPGVSGVGLDMGTNFISVDNFIYQRDGKLVTAFHESVSSEEFLGKLPELGKMSLDAKVNVLGLGFYAGKMFWNIGVNANVSGNMSLSTDIFKALKNLGNQTYDLKSTTLNANAYLDAYLGTSFRVHRCLSFGLKAKFLVGVAAIDAQFDELSATVGSDAVRANMRGQFRANGIFLDGRNLQYGQKLNFDEILKFNWDYMPDAKSYGFAFDVGTEVRLWKNHIKISAALTDFGFIKWAANTRIDGEAKGNFSFDGVNLETSEVNADGGFELYSLGSSYEEYVTKLNFSINGGLEFNFLRNRIALGVLSRNKFYGSTPDMELIASLNLRPTNWLTATVSHTFLNGNRPGIFGAALNFHAPLLNIYVGADYIDPNLVVGPTIAGMQTLMFRYGQSLNLYAGVALSFGRPKYMREEARELKAEYKAKRELRRAKRNN